MKQRWLGIACVSVCAAVWLGGGVEQAVWAQPPPVPTQPYSSSVTEEASRAVVEGGGDSELSQGAMSGDWSMGGAAGFLDNTPDGMAFAVNMHGDRSMGDRVFVGPLLQLAFTDDMTQCGLTAQAKYWVALPDTDGRARLTLQGGVGFVHADVRRDDTSWLIPLGVGLDYELDARTSLTALLLVNFTDLNTGGRSGADVMPGFTMGLRF